jgi:hypothetical protein
MGKDHHIVVHILENKYGGIETFKGGFNKRLNNLGITLGKNKLKKKNNGICIYRQNHNRQKK